MLAGWGASLLSFCGRRRRWLGERQRRNCLRLRRVCWMGSIMLPDTVVTDFLAGGVVLYNFVVS